MTPLPGGNELASVRDCGERKMHGLTLLTHAYNYTIVVRHQHVYMVYESISRKKIDKHVLSLVYTFYDVDPSIK